MSLKARFEYNIRNSIWAEIACELTSASARPGILRSAYRSGAAESSVVCYGFRFDVLSVISPGVEVPELGYVSLDSRFHQLGAQETRQGSARA